MFPKKKIELFSDRSYDVLLESLKEKVSGEQTYQLEALLGERDFTYFGESNFDHYVIERKQSVVIGIMCTPSAEIYIKKMNEGKCIIEIIIRLSIIWIFLSGRCILSYY